MRLSRLLACSSIGSCRRVLTVAGICGIILAVSANADGINDSSVISAGDEPAPSSMREKRIRRLKLADPESTEVMLAGQRSDRNSVATILT